jgi:hypothetical protein
MNAPMIRSAANARGEALVPGQSCACALDSQQPTIVQGVVESVRLIDKVLAGIGPLGHILASASLRLL